jgi:hypothetical protein
MFKLKPLLLAAIMMFATIAAPTTTFAEEDASGFIVAIPEPGERLKDKENWASRELIMNDDDGVHIIIHDSLEVLAKIERYEVVIHGDTLEFCAEDAVLTYANGHITKPIHEVLADGERLVFYVDHSQKSMAEMYAPRTNASNKW